MLGRYGTISLASLLVTAPGQTQVSPPIGHTVIVLGAGQTKCIEFVVEAEKERSVMPSSAGPNTLARTPYALFIGWSEGFISGFNDTRPGISLVGKGSSMKARSQWLENYCRQHPLDSFILANESLVAVLLGEGLQAGK